MRVLLADDHEIFRTGIKLFIESIPDWQVVAEASTGQEALNFLNSPLGKDNIDVIMLDYSMPEMDGLELLTRIRNDGHDLYCILMTGVGSPLIIEKGLESGADAVMSKTGPADELKSLMLGLGESEPHLSPSAQKIIDSNQSLQSLTRRERTVLMLLLRGNATQDVADSLAISFKTAETHKTRLMAKLGLHSIADIIAFGHRHSLIESN